MGCKTMLVLALFATMASVILSKPQRVQVQPVQTLPAEVPEEAKEIISEYFAEKFPQMESEIQTRTGSLFNLSAYLNDPSRPQNTSALTFVPLITLLSGLVG